MVGARRRRQGIGFHLARFLAAAGTHVVGLVGTTPATVAEARDALAREGIRARGSVDARALVADLAPDVLVIASPAPTHDAYLELGLEAGAHVLCEKPLCWGGDDVGGRARRYAEAYRARGLHLAVNAQWPYTLDTWRRLFPAAASPPARFWMRLAPNSAGEAMVPDALPHVLSLLLAVAPGEAPRVEGPAIRVLDARAERIEVRFTFSTSDASIDALVELSRGREQPRVAGYGFDGLRAVRHVDTPEYRLWLEGGGSRVALPDPTPRLVEAFLSRVSSREPPEVDANAWPGTALLEAIAAAWPQMTAT